MSESENAVTKVMSSSQGPDHNFTGSITSRGLRAKYWFRLPFALVKGKPTYSMLKTDELGEKPGCSGPPLLMPAGKTKALSMVFFLPIKGLY